MASVSDMKIKTTFIYKENQYYVIKNTNNGL